MADSVTIPESAIGKYTSKKQVGESGEHNETIGDVTLHREGSTCSPTNLIMKVQPRSIPLSMRKKLMLPYSQPSISVYSKIWPYHPALIKAPKDLEIVGGYSPPHVSVNLPYWLQKDGDKCGKQVKCEFNKLYKDNKPGIRARCGSMTVSVVSTTNEPL